MIAEYQQAEESARALEIGRAAIAAGITDAKAVMRLAGKVPAPIAEPTRQACHRTPQ